MQITHTASAGKSASPWVCARATENQGGIRRGPSGRKAGMGHLDCKGEAYAKTALNAAGKRIYRRHLLSCTMSGNVALSDTILISASMTTNRTENARNRARSDPGALPHWPVEDDGKTISAPRCAPCRWNRPAFPYPPEGSGQNQMQRTAKIYIYGQRPYLVTSAFVLINLLRAFRM